MNKKISIIFLVLTLLTATLFSACQNEPQNTDPPTPQQTTASYDALIKELEQKILDLQKNQYLSENESQAKIQELQNKINELRNEASATTSATTAATTSARSIFIYSLEDGKAIITGFTGDDEHIVIPSQIDGIDVYGIASNAFEDYSFKSVIISEGVEVIDWFAFYKCSKLESITLPNSIRKIGHSAFDGCASKFTIYCHDSSFAKSYAQSYGITYAII